jgi:hypothetical protein
MVVEWRNEELERTVLQQISLDEPWALLERFSQVTRLTGSEDEAKAVDYITGRLSEWGVSHTVHHPTCLISLPGMATLRTTGPNGRSFTVKTSSFSPSTNGQEVTAQLVYVAGSQATGTGDLLGGSRPDLSQMDLRGKVVMTEGMGIAARGVDLTGSGAVAGLFINPGERIHEAITTTSWGSPDLGSLGRVPPVPVLGINKPEGEALKAMLQQGPVEVTFSNQVDIGWRPIPVIVAEIKGTGAPDEFVLFHGHLDSWHIGIGDNATGDATLLETARVLQQNRDALARTIRIAWWSGHSHGRYAGSTWYADAFGLDLAANCVAHVNCDSPGCRWATEYRDVMAMAEAGGLVKSTVKDLTGQNATLERPLRAGDCSFNNLGISTCFMLSSTMPMDLVQEKHYYPVGGCGGNIAWHTEDDTMQIADRDNLLRDIRVYVGTLLRLLNAPVYPLDYRATANDIAGHVAQYQEAAGQHFDFSPALQAAKDLAGTLDRFYEHARSLSDRSADDPEARAVNALQRDLARALVTVGYSRDGRFRQDPASRVVPLPELAPANALRNEPPGSPRANVIGVDLVRGQNRLVWALRQAERRIAAHLA